MYVDGERFGNVGVVIWGFVLWVIGNSWFFFIVILLYKYIEVDKEVCIGVRIKNILIN